LNFPELQNFLNRLYSTVINLAGQLNTMHTQVEKMKNEFEDVSRIGIGSSMAETPNPLVFDREAYASTYMNRSAIFPEVPLGPSPLNGKATSLLVSMSDLKNRHIGPPPVNSLVQGSVVMSPASVQQPLAFGSPNVGNMSFNQSGLFGSPVQNQSGFQLQKPPMGNKRGKR
jgi:hypothetical protein